MTPPKTGTELRREALKMVEQCICNDRQKTHGDAEDNFANIATIANIVLKNKLTQPLDALDVALFSMCIKMGRCATSPRHLDNLIDHAGYAMCGAGIVLRENLDAANRAFNGEKKHAWGSGIKPKDEAEMHRLSEIISKEVPKITPGHTISGTVITTNPPKLEEARQ